MTEERVWDQVVKPLSTGAAYMTELASKTAERRGIGLNRWLKAVYDHLVYQKEEETKRRNKFILKENVFGMFYDEIDKIFPSIEYCLAPKKVPVFSGAKSLRSS